MFYMIQICGLGTREILSGPSPAKGFGKPVSTFVDTALALDELIKMLGMGLVFQSVPQHPRPFRPGALVDLCRIGSAANDRRKRLVAS